MTRGFLDRPDCRLYYEAEGAGPVLVFAHGLGGNHMSWWQQVPHFRDRYTCVTFSHRGFAPSSAPPGGPDPAEYARRSCGTGRSSRRVRRAHRRAIDGRLERARLCACAAGARARAGARLDGRDRWRGRRPCSRPDNVRALASARRSGAAPICSRGHPRRPAASAWRASSPRCTLSLSRDRCAQRRPRQDRAARTPDGGAAASAELAHARTFRRSGSPARRTSSIRHSSPTRSRR